MDDLSVRTYVRASVCPVHCGKTAERIRMPFGVIGWTGPGMRQVVGFGDRFTGRGTLGGRIRGAPLYRMATDFRSDAALFQNYSGQTCYYSVTSFTVSDSVILTLLTLSLPAVPNCCCSKGPATYWSNPPFLIFDMRALWRSVLSARAPECQKLKIVG